MLTTIAGVPVLIRHIVGLDIGQSQDPSALALVESIVRPGSDVYRQTYHCRFLFRWKLGTPYHSVAAELAEFLPHLSNPLLVVDQTGVGRPVVEMIKKELARTLTKSGRPPAGGVVCVTITGGVQSTHIDDGDWHVPKQTLVSVMTSLLQSRRFQVSSKLALAKALTTEFHSFKLRVSNTGAATFGATGKAKDDLTLACLLATWAAENLHWPPRQQSPQVNRYIAPDLDARWMPVARPQGY